MRTPWIRPVALAAAACALTLGLTVPAAAEPATPVGYPAGSSATRFTGLAFDTCTAPTVAQLTAWKASPYRAVGIYIGGPNRTCAQPQLTASWVNTVSRLGWRLIPIYMGRQAPCTFRANATEITGSQAAAQGTASAADAIAKAKALGLLPGSAIYGDMEHYNASDSSCQAVVLRYLSSWTKELHRQGYLSGIYAHINSGAQHLSLAYPSTSYARPDALWIARWDLNSALTGWPGISNNKWANHQRAKQYRGDHNETWNGVTLNIDSDRFDAPVATVAYNYTMTSSRPLASRTGPSMGYAAVATYQPRSVVRVVCQVTGTKVGTTSVWNKLTSGAFITDYYVNTLSNTGYTSWLPQCSYPYQTTVDGLTKRSGPGTTYGALGSMPVGSLAWVVCQRLGTKVGTTAVWDRLDDRSWVTDYYVATPSQTTFSKPAHRC
ncbi:glycoside hydrolase domain-containing protein [Kribbella deserti]|uniref:Glycoside hydrolase domain-containing protein n=1 Tax=Kribbella deserti TaxID=1926257 RepID=A0ABV6QXZ1_9ACTN